MEGGKRSGGRNGEGRKGSRRDRGEGGKGVRGREGRGREGEMREGSEDKGEEGKGIRRRQGVHEDEGDLWPDWIGGGRVEAKERLESRGKVEWRNRERKRKAKEGRLQ